MKTTKKLWSVVLGICLGLTMLCTMPAAAADAYADWTLTSGVVKPDGTSPEGGNFLELTADYDTKITAAAHRDYFDVAPGKLNVLSFCYKSGVDGLAQLTMYERTEDGSSNGTYTLRLPGTGGKWEKCSYGFVPTEKGVKVTLRLEAYYYYAQTENIVCYDGVKIEEATDGVLIIPAGETGYHGVIGGLAAKDEKIRVTGRIKAGADAAVKMAVQLDSVVDEAAMGGKSLTAQWRDFSVSGITYLAKGTALKLVAGTSAISLQNVKFEKDANLLPEASMEDISEIGRSSVTWLKSNRIDGIASGEEGDETVGYKTDGDCPDGSGYLYMGQGTKGYIYTSSLQDVAAGGTRYLISFWYKTNSDQASVRIQQRLSGTYYNSPQLDLADTKGEWKKAELVTEKITGGDRYYFQIGNFTTSAFGEGEYLACDLVSMMPLEDCAALGLYSVSGTVAEGSDVTYGSYLGDRIEKPDSTIASISAVYPDETLSAFGTKVSSKVVVIAAYTKNQNGAMQLVSVSFSTADSAATTVQYPTAALDASGLAEGTEIRAFLWDGTSALKPAGTVIKTTK